MMRIGLFLLTNLAVLVVAGLVLSLLGVGSYHGAGGLNLTNLLVFCLVFGMAGSFVSLFMSKWIAKKTTGTQVIENPSNQAEQWLLNTVAELSQRAGIKMPEVGIFYSSQSNAFATGWNKNDALVAVSSGDFVDRALFGRGDGEAPGLSYYAITIVLDIVFGILASAIVMWFSRYREYRADEAGARLAGKQHMINALLRLRDEQNLPDQMPKEMQALAIAEGQHQGFSLAALFHSHPSIEKRVAALQKLQVQ